MVVKRIQFDHAVSAIEDSQPPFSFYVCIETCYYRRTSGSGQYSIILKCSQVNAAFKQ